MTGRHVQPSGAVRANPRWLARGLRFLYNGSGGYTDAVSGRAITPVNAPSLKPAGKYGVGFGAVAAANQYVLVGNPDELKNISGSITVGVAFINQTTGDAQLFSKDDETGGRPWALDIGNAGADTRFYLEGGGGAGDIVSSTGAMGSNDGKPYLIVGRWRSSDRNLALWVNGVGRASSTTTRTSISIAPANIMIGRREYSGFEGNATGVFPLAFIFSEALTDAEIRNLSANPWELFSEVDEPLLFAPSAAGASYTDSLTDASDASDTASTVLSAVDAITDSGALTDAASSVLSAIDALSDAGALTDDATPATVRTDALADSAAATDESSSVLSAVDALADSGALTDTASSAHVAVDALVDSLAATDTATGSVAANTYTDSLTDALAASDSATSAHVAVEAVADTAAVTDAMASVAVMADLLADLAAGSDIVVGALITADALADSAALEDESTGTIGSQVFTDALTDALVATDAFTDALRAVGVRGASARTDTAHRMRADTATRSRSSGSSRSRRV